jgi:uncharacterized membrane protein YfhO
MKSFLKRFWPIGYILFVWFLFSAPYFIQHKVPYPSKYQVTHFTPWNQYEQFAGPVKNGSMPDIIDEIYPWRHFTIEELKKGQLPIWNPYSFSGNPHLANYQSAVFSPFNVLFFILPFVDAWSVLVLLQPLLAGLFTYLFLRTLGASKIGSTLGSVAYMFCGFLVIWMAYGTLSMAIAFLPLILFAMEKSFGTHHSVHPFARNGWCFLLIALGIATSFFSGHFQMAVYVALYSFSYLLFKYATTKNSRIFIWAAGAFALGIIVSLLQILPSLELYKFSIRSELFSSSGGIPLQYLVTIFAPDFFGSPVTRNDWMGYYNEWGTFIGIVPLLLGIMAVFYGLKKKTVLFFFIAGISTLLLSVDTPLQNIIASLKLPIFSTSIPSRLAALFSFSFSILAAFGFDFFVIQLKEKRRKKIFPPFVILLLVIVCIWMLLVVFKTLPPDKLQIASRNMILPTGIFFIIFLGTISAFVIRKKIVIVSFMVLMLIIASFDSLRFASKWMPFDPKELVFPQMPVISAAQKLIGSGRMYGDYLANVDTYYRLPGIDGYDPVYNKRYGEFIQSASKGEFVSAQRSVVALDKRGKYADRVLDLLGVGLIYHSYSDTDKPWAYPVWEKLDKYKQVYKDEKFQLFHNETALPHATLFYNYEIINNDKQIIKRFYSQKFDFRNVLILEENPGLETRSIHSVSSGREKQELRSDKHIVKITSYEPNRVVISVSTDEPGLLFLSDSYYPKWKVKINGREEKIYRADYAFRAVVVPQGESIVEFYYSGLF